MNSRFNHSPRKRLFAVGFIAWTFLLGLVLQLSLPTASPQTQGVSDQVQLEASVSTIQLNLTTHPGARTPATGNWAHGFEFNLHDCGSNTNLVSINPNSANSNGDSVVAIPSSANISGSNRIYVRGESHLNKDLGCIDFATQAVTASFTAGAEELIPGEVSNVYDNYINSLDISPLINDFSGNTVKYDLNRDGLVNQSDLNILVDSLYVNGD